MGTEPAAYWDAMRETVLNGTGHAVFRDDLTRFVSVVDRWLSRTLPAAS